MSTAFAIPVGQRPVMASCSSATSTCTAAPRPSAYLPDLIERIVSRRIAPGRVFDLTLPFDRAADAYQALDERRAIKAPLTF